MNKARKIYRYWRARLQPGPALPFFWHIGRPNFGDDLNPGLFAALLGRPVRLQTRRDAPHFLGMGSILERASGSSVVLGAGCLHPPVPGSLAPGRVVAVRGALSLAGLRQPEGVLLGDPMVLLSLLGPPWLPEAGQGAGPDGGGIGLVPHVTEIARARAMAPPGITVIDPRLPPWQVIRAIAGCARIFSQSLHGLIVADALGIPNLWLAPGAGMAGGDFKFRDYFTTLKAAKTPHPFTPQVLAGSADFSVGRYRYDKAAYWAALRHAVQP